MSSQYCSPNVALPSLPNPNSNVPLFIGAPPFDTSASHSIPNSCLQNTYMQSHTKPLAFFFNFSPFLPATQRYPYTTNSLSTNYWFAPYSLMLPPSGATHHFPITEISKYYNPNVLELSMTTPDTLLSPTSTPLSHSNPSISSFIAWQNIFFHNCSTHPNPLVCQIGNYTLSDLHTQYRK